MRLQSQSAIRERLLLEKQPVPGNMPNNAQVSNGSQMLLKTSEPSSWNAPWWAFDSLSMGPRQGAWESGHHYRWCNASAASNHSGFLGSHRGLLVPAVIDLEIDDYPLGSLGRVSSVHFFHQIE